LYQGKTSVLKREAIPSLGLPIRVHEKVRTSEVIATSEKRTQRFSNRNQPPTPLHSEQLFLPVSENEINDEQPCEIEIKIEPDFDGKQNGNL
jgi:hypothetical protein